MHDVTTTDEIRSSTSCFDFRWERQWQLD